MQSDYKRGGMMHRPNPHTDYLNQQVMLPMRGDTLDFFKTKASQRGISYTHLINLYLQNFVQAETRITLDEDIEPKEEIALLDGQLLMLDLRGNQCHIYLTDTKFVVCTFDDELRDGLRAAIHDQIHVIGIAETHPTRDEMISFHIQQIVVGDPVTQLALYKAEFDSVASFKRGWSEAIGQETYSIDSLWEGVDGDGEASC